MVFMLICWAGLIFVAITLPRALWRGDGGVGSVPRLGKRQNRPRPYWKQNALAKDRVEYLEMWAKVDEDPLNNPAPIPPSHPTKYFGSGK